MSTNTNPLGAGLSAKQLALHPGCNDCGWRRGGVDSWDGKRCKCGKSEPTFAQLFAAAAAADAAIAAATGSAA